MRKASALGVLLVLGLLTAACGESTTATTAAEAPDKILIGNVIALSGPVADPAMTTQVSSYETWAADVNADGGIYVAEYDKKIPVEFVQVDDTSDPTVAVAKVQEMVEAGDVNFIFPPWGTAWNFAIAPIISEAQTPVIGCTVGSKELIENASSYPYFYTILNQHTDQGTALVELLQDLGVETVAVVHHDDLFGIDFAQFVEPALTDAGIDIVFQETYSINPTDLSQMLRSAQAANPDAFLAFSYPDETFLMTGQAIEIGFNPKLFMEAVGVAFPSYRDTFGPNAEGVVGTGAWNAKVGTEDAQGFFDRHVALHNAEPDRWASASCYATGQVLQQAIAAAGTLDPVKVKQAMDTTEFNTIVGTFMFENQFNPTYPGQIGQWQNGEFEIVSPTADRTAEPIYAKPEWQAG